MLQNAYFLAKIGADTAENEQHFAEILPISHRVVDPAAPSSFSAVSKRNFARKYTFDSIFQALQDVHTFAPLQSQNLIKKSV